MAHSVLLKFFGHYPHAQCCKHSSCDEGCQLDTKLQLQLPEKHSGGPTVPFVPFSYNSICLLLAGPTRVPFALTAQKCGIITFIRQCNVSSRVMQKLNELYDLFVNIQIIQLATQLSTTTYFAYLAKFPGARFVLGQKKSHSGVLHGETTI